MERDDGRISAFPSARTKRARHSFRERYSKALSPSNETKIHSLHVNEKG